MTSKLEYFPNQREVLNRYRRFYEDRSQTIVLATMEVPSSVQEEFTAKHPHGPCPYPDPHESLAYWDSFLAERAAIHDDFVPSAFLTEMNQGLYGGLFGGEVRFLRDGQGFVSSMVVPLLNELCEMPSLSFSIEGKWFGKYVNQLEVFINGAADKFGVSHLASITGLNVAFEMVGATKTFMALYECPDMLREAMDIGFEVNKAVHDTFFAKTPLLEHGTTSFPYGWIPGRIIPESIDPFTMTSVDCFQQWGLPALEQILSQYDGGVTHIHGNGRHTIEAACSVKEIKGLRFCDDGNVPPAFDVQRQLKGRCGEMPILLPVPYQKFRPALDDHDLLGGVLYKVTDVPDSDTANRTMDQVRTYQP